MYNNILYIFFYIFNFYLFFIKKYVYNSLQVTKKEAYLIVVLDEIYNYFHFHFIILKVQLICQYLSTSSHLTNAIFFKMMLTQFNNYYFIIIIWHLILSSKKMFNDTIIFRKCHPFLFEFFIVIYFFSFSLKKITQYT